MPSRQSVPRRAVALVLASLLAAPLAPAARAAEPPAAPAPSLTQPATPAAPAEPNGADMDFDLFGDQKKSPEEESADKERVLKLERTVQTRRRMLTTHQAFGFATLALLAATLVVGQLNYQDKFVDGDYSQKIDLNTPHLVLGIGTEAAFMTTGALGLFAPNPYPKPIKFDTSLIHKVSMALAAVGMVAQAIIGPVSARVLPGSVDQRSTATAHLAIGWATYAFMATGVIVNFF